MVNDDDEPQFTSLKERIAALKLQQNGGAPPSSGHAPVPTPAATKWIPADSDRHASSPAAPEPPLRKVPSWQGNGRAVPAIPHRPSVQSQQPGPSEEEDEAADSHARPLPARRHPSATRLPPTKPKPTASYQRMMPPKLEDDDADENTHATPPPALPRRSPAAGHSATLPTAPAFPRRSSAVSATSAGSSDAVPPPPVRRPSDTAPAAAKRAAPPLPGARRPALPPSVFMKAGQKPTSRDVEPEPEAEPEPAARRMPPSIPGMKPTAAPPAKPRIPQRPKPNEADEHDDDEAPVVTSVAARAAALARTMPPPAPVPGRRPTLPRRGSSHTEEAAASPPKPALPSSSRPPLPSAARPTLPTSARPPLPASQRPATRPVPAPAPAPEPEVDNEEEAPAPPPTSVAARAAALGRRLPPPASGGKPPPLVQHAHEDDEAPPPPPPVPSWRPGQPNPPPVQRTPSPGPPGPPPVPGNRPPPVPMGTRPRAQPAAAAVDLSPARPFDYDNAPQGSSCLICRDFSGPDNHAAQFPLASLPRDDPVGYLAAALCKPFDSATDKARAIFTWCHHNIAYDVEGFFGNNIPRGQTTAQQLFSGKAVCEGYGKIYEAIASKAGLDVVIVTGHGKGFGYQWSHGDPPPEITGHAWNAVRIDGGEWKLIDACWGAGAVEPGRYIKRFEPLHFVASNEQFGWRHYPDDHQSFFRADGSVPSFDDYLLGPTNGWPTPQFYGAGHEEGFDKYSLQPEVADVDISAYAADSGYVRFMVSHVCEHYVPETNGPGAMYPFVLNINPSAGKNDLRPLETDGFFYWLDVPAADLGTGGGEVFMSLITTINDESARGKGNDYFLKKKGRAGMSWTHVASWKLV